LETNCPSPRERFSRMKESSRGEARIRSKSMNASRRRARGSAEKSESPVTGLCRRLGRKALAMEPISVQARSSISTPPLA
jgi:hypothetical protein